ncbi:pentatricopeptide repeat-containing protein At2g03880, mitochondrial [Durio zibethinus]|uniref:Pentatricopeptide repeat-containing protein At2g03880, mitochondrial n=1 Tax=Durio zibethinus TaxID=66656 RepID=A0A6P5ZXR9_DURZI|nr:pentatricopeptide repeat-containing protein At2g03880, mitochondrial [Durio zibethinus]
MIKLSFKYLNFSFKSCHRCIHVRCIHFHFGNSSQSKLDCNRALNELSKLSRINEARKLFDKMSERDEFTWNTMIAAYANSGKLTEAMVLFKDTPMKSSVTWNSLISGYCRRGMEIEAFDLFWGMQFEGQRPNQYTMGSILRLCSTLGLLQRGKQVHGYVIKTQFESNDYVVTGLVDMYAKCNCILEAEYLFKMMPDTKNHVMWTAMVAGYSQNGEAFKAIECYRDMVVEGVECNQFTFPSVLTACAAVQAGNFGAQVHGCIIRSGFEANVFVQSALVDMYAKCRDLDSAMRVLENMEVDDVVSWNSMIVGCVRQGCEEEALSLFQKMHARDMKLDDFTYPSVLNCFASMKDMKNAMSVQCLIVKTGFQAYKLVNNALVDMYAKQGNLDCAFQVFNHMPNKDVVSWTSLVTGYAHNGRHEAALKLFCDMRIAGICPDHIVLASILSACSELTILEFGQQVHANFVKSGLQSSISVDNSLVTMYARCGCIEEASRVFDSMQIQDVITWTALIVGYAQNGKGKDSVRFYDQMIASGTKPDFITFIGLLFACSHAGLWESGRFYFASMEKVYGIKPGPEHYACMIDLLGRSGKLVEAETLLYQMDVEPDATVWKALLAACRVHGNLELGERAAKNLFELEPTNAVPYIMLSNMYSASGKWEDAARIRRMMKSRGITKEPGFSWIEINGKVHSFMSEDRGHPRTADIYTKIDEIMLLIKEAGYVPEISFALHNTDEEGKELGLAYHSEKLAIAFGLLNVPLGAPIRIFKNLRVCGDCHTAVKYISRVFLRHIILRDSNCFHHFKQGHCSCGDYW